MSCNDVTLAVARHGAADAAIFNALARVFAGRAHDEPAATAAPPVADSPDSTDAAANTRDRTDEALMKLAGGGDNAALRLLIARWQGPLMNFFHRSTRSVQTAEDLTQSVFIRVHRHSASYVPSARFASYLFHIARNILINEHRRRLRKPAEPFDPTDFNMENAAVCDDESARRCVEIEEAFSRAILELTENQRTALLLLKQQELSYEEIADIMETTPALVKSWIFRGRQRLKELLQDL